MARSIVHAAIRSSSWPTAFAYKAPSATPSSLLLEVDRLRHSATAALLGRRDVIVVASVSCIYGLGSPEEYAGQLLRVMRGARYEQLREFAFGNSA